MKRDVVEIVNIILLIRTLFEIMEFAKSTKR